MKLIGEWWVGEHKQVHIVLERNLAFERDVLTVDMSIQYLFHIINNPGDLSNKIRTLALALFEPEDCIIADHMTPTGQYQANVTISGRLRKHPQAPEGWGDIFSTTPLLNSPSEPSVPGRRIDDWEEVP